MKDAIATIELFAEEPGHPRRSYIVSIARPLGADTVWRCRVKMTGDRFDATHEAADSLTALAAALRSAKTHLETLTERGWRFFTAATGTSLFDPRSIAIE